MTDRPIIFNGPMVRAILDGRKTQTRRFITKPAVHDAISVFGPSFLLKPGNADLLPAVVGDRLWCRETWVPNALTYGHTCLYRADGIEIRSEDGGDATWRPSIHMPRWASRLTLTVTDVRVQRLQEISEEDATAEGMPVDHNGDHYAPPSPEADSWQGYGRASFSLLWSSLYGPKAWEENPWVAAIIFTAERRNIDAESRQ